MEGLRIKEEIKRRGFTIREIANKIGALEQNLGKKLTYPDISSGLMESIAAAMGIDVIEFYGHTTGDNISAAYNSTAFKGNPSCDPKLLDLIANRDKQIDKLHEQNMQLLNVINELRIENQQLILENANLKASLSILCKDEENDKNS